MVQSVVTEYESFQLTWWTCDCGLNVAGLTLVAAVAIDFPSTTMNVLLSMPGSASASCVFWLFPEMRARRFGEICTVPL